MIDNEQPQELDWLDAEQAARLEPQAREWLDEVSQYFPDPPVVQTIHWFGGKSSLITQESGVGGFSYAPGEVSLAWDTGYQGTKEQQLLNLKDAVFHEFYHQVQGYVGTGGSLGDLSPLQVAVYEGAATVFARDKTGVADAWTDYSDLSGDDINKIRDELTQIGASDDWDWNAWKFNHPKYGKYVLYKLGVYFVEQYLEDHPDIQIEDMARLLPEDILQ
jgi:hypothetical protein